MIRELFEDYDVDWKADLLDEPVTVESGELQLPTGAGLGVDFDIEVVSAHQFTGENAESMNLFESGGNHEQRMSENRGPQIAADYSPRPAGAEREPPSTYRFACGRGHGVTTNPPGTSARLLV